MDFDEVLAQILDLLQRQGKVSYSALRRRFDLDDAYLNDLKDELLFAHPVVDEQDRGLVWTGDSGSSPTTSRTSQETEPVSYTPPYLAEKILTSRSALEGERKQVTVLFADIKDSTELIRDLDPEDAQKLLDPAIHIMMEAVHRFEGTVNQVLGDGIMSLFGAPIAYEDHAARACYAALAMQAVMQTYQRGMPPQAVYTFKHALIQDTAYQSLLHRTRQQYHQRIATVLESQFADKRPFRTLYHNAV